MAYLVAGNFVGGNKLLSLLERKQNHKLAYENIVALTFISLYAPRNFFYQLFLYVERKTNLNQGGLIAMKREPFYTKDLHFAAFLLLEGYQPEIKVPFQGAKKVMFLYPDVDFSTLRDLRTRFEGDKNLTVNLFDYVRAMRELGDRINYIKRETLKKEAGQNDRNEGAGQ